MALVRSGLSTKSPNFCPPTVVLLLHAACLERTLVELKVKP